MPQGHAGKIPFLNGKRWSPGLHTRYVMEHAGSRKANVSAGQMWDFTQTISNKDLGTILRYTSTRKMSRRMMILCRKMIQKFPHMLHDIPGWYFLVFKIHINIPALFICKTPSQQFEISCTRTD